MSHTVGLRRRRPAVQRRPEDGALRAGHQPHLGRSLPGAGKRRDRGQFTGLGFGVGSALESGSGSASGSWKGHAAVPWQGLTLTAGRMLHVTVPYETAVPLCSDLQCTVVMDRVVSIGSGRRAVCPCRANLGS